MQVVRPSDASTSPLSPSIASVILLRRSHPLARPILRPLHVYQHEQSYRHGGEALLCLHLELDIDTNDTTTDLKLPMSTRFGATVLEVKVEDPQKLAIGFDWPRWSIGCLGRGIETTGVLSFLDVDGTATEVSSQTWDTDSTLPNRYPGCPGSAWGLKLGHASPEQFRRCWQQHSNFKPKKHRRFRYEIKFLDAEPAAYIATAPLSPKPMRVAVASVSSQCPNNLRLVFPRANAELWTNAEALAEASSYFKTLLASEGFTESVVRGRKRARTGSVVIKVEGGREASQQATPPAARAEGEGEQEAESRAEAGGDDSDDETDNFINQSGAAGAGQGDINADIAYREVIITESAYSTYRAVLVYLHTSHITFAPLTSTLLPSSSLAKVTRAAYLETMAEDEPFLPLPVSPKAVYALAHLLELPNLMALALAEIKAQLTVENAAGELTSSNILKYDDIRKVAMDFIVAHWDQVKASRGMEEVKRKVKEGLMPHAGPFL